MKKQAEKLLTIFTMCLAILAFQMLLGKQVHAESVLQIAERTEGTIDQNNREAVYTFRTDNVNTFSYVIDYQGDANLLVQVCDSKGTVLKECSDWIAADGFQDLFGLRVDDCAKGTQYQVKISAPADQVKEVKYSLAVYKSNAYGSAKLAKPYAVYNGKKIRLPKITVYDKAGKKLDSSEYTYWIKELYYESEKPVMKYAKEIGKYDYYVAYGKEYYHDESEGECGNSQLIEATFEIRPERAKIAKVESKSGKITATCKSSKNAKTYSWQLATDQKFKNIVKTAVWSSGTKKTFRNLKKGKVYYVRVAIDANDFVRGAYSKPVKVKCK